MSKKRLLKKARALSGNGVPVATQEPQKQGWDLFRQGNYREALNVWEKAPPAVRAEAFFRLGLEQRTAGKTKSALSCFQKAVQLRPGRAVYHFHCGLTAHLLDDLTLAVDSYRKALALNFDQDRVLFHLGLTLLRLKPQQFETWLKGEGRGLALPKRRFLLAAARVSLGQALAKRGDIPGTYLLQAMTAAPPTALALIDEALALDTQNPVAWRMRALALAARGDQETNAALQKALELGSRREEMVPRVTELKKERLNQMVQASEINNAIDFLVREGPSTLDGVDPGSKKLAFLLRLQGNDSARRQEWERAAASWRRAREFGNLDPRLLHNLALVAELLKQPREAGNYWRRTIDAWTAALKANPSDNRLNHFLARAYYHLAELEADQGNFERYVSVLELAIKYSPRDVGPRLDLARALISSDEPLKGLAVLEETLPLDPDNPNIISGLAISYIKMAMWEKAAPLLEHGMAVAPDDPHVRQCMSRYFKYQARHFARDYKPFIHWMEKALAVDPNPASVLIEMAVHAHVNKHRNDWNKYLKEALVSSANHSNLHFAVAREFFDYDRWEMGKKHIKLALSLAPHNIDTLLEAADLYMEGDFPNDAVKCLNQAIKIDPSVETHEKAIELCIDNDEYEVALKIVTAARKAFPHKKSFVVHMIGILTYLDEFDKAYEVFLETGLSDPMSDGEIDFRAFKKFMEEEVFD